MTDELIFKTGPDTVRVIKGVCSLEFETRGPRGGLRYLSVPSSALPGLAALIDPPPAALPKAAERLFAEQIARMTLTTETECGQCEGTGTTDAMGHSEECPVCDGSGQIDGASMEEGAGETLDALIIKARELAKQPRGAIYQLFAARDGDTVSERIDVTEARGEGLTGDDDEVAEKKACAIIVKAFRLEDLDDAELEEVRAECDGVELEPVTA